MSNYRSLSGLPRERRRRTSREETFPTAWDSFDSDGLPPRGLSEGLRAGECRRRRLWTPGLILEGRNGFYDRFRGRLIFPVRDIAGRLLAFGGRLVDGEGAKYINSPEGTLYSKRKNLYLLHKAKESARASGRIILVEGYMDAIRLHLGGFGDTAASLGTALTEDQGALIRRLADRCCICYDSTRRQEAAIRGMYVLQKAGLTCGWWRRPGQGSRRPAVRPGARSLKALGAQGPDNSPCLFRGKCSVPEKRRAADEIIAGWGALPWTRSLPSQGCSRHGDFPHEPRPAGKAKTKLPSPPPRKRPAGKACGGFRRAGSGPGSPVEKRPHRMTADEVKRSP